MKQYKKRIFGILLSFALMLTMMPVLGLNQTAYAVNWDTWSEDQIFNDDASFESGVEVTSNITITIAEGKTVRVENGIYAEGKTLTVEGKGNLIVNGYNSSGGSGGRAFIGNIIVKGGKVTLTGGEGGSGDNDTGGNGIDGNVEVRGGSFSATGGNGHTVGRAVSNTITCENGIVAQGSANGSEWSDISDTSSNKQYVRTIQTYPLWVGGTQVSSVNADNILGDNTASYDDSKKTLTLNGATITKGLYVGDESDSEFGIYYNGSEPLIIDLADGSVNTVKIAWGADNEFGIYVDDSSSDPAGLAISGKGKLTVSGGHSGIYANYSEVSISGSTVTAIGGWTGIYAYSGIDIIDSTVTTEGGNGIYVNGNVNISGGNVNATGMYSGINANRSVTINSGNIVAEGRYGITGELVTINDGTVNATGMNNEVHSSGMSTMKVADPAGIWADGAVEIKGGKVIAAGDGHGILAFGLVKNHIDGTGWTDKAGTAGKTAIAINKEGQDLVAYKKVQFPAKVDPKPTPTPTPTPKTNAPKVTTTAKTSAMAMTVKWTMKWGKVNGAKSYKVAYRKVGSKKWTYKNTKKTSYVVKGHKMKGLYEYKVAAVSKKGTVWSGTSRRYFNGVKANAKAAKGAIKASWKKDKGATGYQVLVATNKKMNNSKVYNVSSSAKSYKVKGLKKGKTYYVRVRPMKNAGGVTYKGILSKIHKVKVK